MLKIYFTTQTEQVAIPTSRNDSLPLSSSSGGMHRAGRPGEFSKTFFTSLRNYEKLPPLKSSRDTSVPKMKKDHLSASATHFGEKYNYQMRELREY